jgi:hypothetical protein
MEPLATGNSLDLSTPHVIAIMAIAVASVVVAVGVRRFVMAYGDELAELWRLYGPIALRRLLEHRTMPQTPWYCDRCRSHNARATTRCYACGASRAEAEAPVPDADTPAGPSAGRSQRNRR